MSIVGGMQKAIERGQSIGCTCIQIFTSFNNRWEQKILRLSEIQSFKDIKRDSTIKRVVAHNSYLHNLASPDPVLYLR
ncbi:MAG: hypothetical protein M1426_02585 [Patescibacteria group bacterium]|nr:hypothetical protein [Patescibacteria group bacterium]